MGALWVLPLPLLLAGERRGTVEESWRPAKKQESPWRLAELLLGSAE